MVPEEYSATLLTRLPQVDEAGGCAHIPHAHPINDRSDLKNIHVIGHKLDVCRICCEDLSKLTVCDKNKPISNSGVDSDFVWPIFM
jgi:hypothetical protein